MSAKPQLPDSRVALVTGGGTGLGLGFAKALYERGYCVVITGRREGVLREAVASIKSLCKAHPNGGSDAHGITCDVRDAAAVAKAIDEAVKLCGGRLPSIVMNNAAGNFISPAERVTPNGWKAIMDIVFLGTVIVSTEVARRWIALLVDPASELQNKTADVLFIQVGASYAGKGQPFVAASAAAKSATLSLTQSLAGEWGKYGFRTLMISPGPIYTEGAFSRLDPNGALSKKSDMSSAVPLGRFGTPDEYARFLSDVVCSPNSKWLSGANLHFDGGAATVGGEFAGLQQLTAADWRNAEKAVRSKNAADRAARAKPSKL